MERISYLKRGVYTIMERITNLEKGGIENEGENKKIRKRSYRK